MIILSFRAAQTARNPLREGDPSRSAALGMTSLGTESRWTLI